MNINILHVVVGIMHMSVLYLLHVQVLWSLHIVGVLPLLLGVCFLVMLVLVVRILLIVVLHVQKDGNTYLEQLCKYFVITVIHRMVCVKIAQVHVMPQW